jgi:hypothetical protein
MLVTPEITVPLSATDPKPALDFPNSFLVPVETNAIAAQKKDGKKK